MAAAFTDHRVPPSHRLEALPGDREGQDSVCVNDPWRGCFIWTDRGAMEIEVNDFHWSANPRNHQTRRKYVRIQTWESLPPVKYRSGQPANATAPAIIAQKFRMHPSGTPILDTFDDTNYTHTMQYDAPKQMSKTHTVAISAAAGAATRVLR